MKQIKRNKLKVWRKTYGKPFIARKACHLIQMTSIAAVSRGNIFTIKSAFGNSAGKALAIAEVVLATNKAIINTLNDMNKGFVTK